MNRLTDRLALSAFGRSWGVLSPKDRNKVWIVAALQILMSLLDLMGVVAIGLLGALSVSGLQENAPVIRVNSVLELLHISNMSFQMQSAILGIGALIFLVGRTCLSIFFTRRILLFFSRRGAKISADLVSRLLSQPLLIVQARTSQETLYAVTRGVESIVLQVLATTVVLISDVSLLIVMAVGLFVVDSMTALVITLVFTLIGYFLYHFMHFRAGNLGKKSSELNIVSNEKIVEVFASYREAVVRNRRDFYAREIGDLRFSLANVTAEMNFLPYVSKYVIETAVIIGAILIGFAQFFLQDAQYAVATIAIFLAAGSRIAPAVLRIQQGSITIRGAIGQAEPTLDLIDTVGSREELQATDNKVDILHEGFNSEIQIKNVSLTYPSNVEKAVSDITLNIPTGASVAFVGPSGAGKTTIIDILLGVLNPDEGTVLISEVSPSLAVRKWPGAISYVPQDVIIVNGTIRDNVALGYPREEATNELVMSALKIAHLDQFIAGLSQGIDTQVGERGTKLSGGQRQRLGIARAMFTRPHLLVLDEATSALDGNTEASISKAIHELRGSITVVMIAHRLSTIKNADIVFYMSSGSVLARGTFDEVRKAVPDFELQAKLMGL